MVALKPPRDATVGVFSVTQPYRFASVWRSLPAALSAPLWLPFVSSTAIAAWTLTFFETFPTRYSPALICAMWVPIVPGLAGQALFGYYTILQARSEPPSILAGGPSASLVRIPNTAARVFVYLGGGDTALGVAGRRIRRSKATR